MGWWGHPSSDIDEAAVPTNSENDQMNGKSLRNSPIQKYSYKTQFSAKERKDVLSVLSADSDDARLCSLACALQCSHRHSTPWPFSMTFNSAVCIV